MRADCLLSILLLLQTRGRLTAPTLAAELEVSPRTIYRDIDALCAAGVPIYSDTGPDGGYSLLDSYRTSLTGLTDGELRALFMLSVPAPLADLGLRGELQSALLKLAAARPDAHRADHAATHQRVHVDAVGWHAGQTPVPHLTALHSAVQTDRRVALTYAPLPTVTIAESVAPYGLVAKAGDWYLVYAHAGRVAALRVAELQEVQLLDEDFERPVEFALVDWWQAWCNAQARLRTGYPVTVRVAPDFVSYLPQTLGDAGRAALDHAPQPDAAGWVTVELTFASLFAARERLLGLGRAVEVLAPEALRRSVADVAEQIAALYMER